jgi:esterase
MPRRPWTSSTVMTSDAVALSVRSAGGSDRPTVVLLNGLGTPQQTWNQVTAKLDPTYRVITFDYRGHARSGSGGSYGFETFLDDLGAVLDAFAARNPILCGWSLGADLAIWHAVRNPESTAGVIVLDGAIPAEPTRSDDEWIRRKMNGVPARAVGRVARLMNLGHRISTDEFLAIIRDVESWRGRVLAAYAELTCPVVVALGARPSSSVDPEADAASWRAGAEKLTAAHPSVPVTWLDCDHAIPLRRPAEVAALIDQMAVRSGAR